MGNHAIGRQVVAVANALWTQRTETGLAPLAILDIACKGVPVGCDIEFDDALWEGDFYELLTAAFSEKPVSYYDALKPQSADDEENNEWEEDVGSPFYQRYKLDCWERR